MADVPSLVVLISGSGSNLAALIEACRTGVLRARIAAVVSNRRDAAGLQRAQDAGIPTHHAPLAPYRGAEGGVDRDRYDADLATLVAGYGPVCVVCAGFLHILSPTFLSAFPVGAVLNLHPALPGDLPGLNAIERAWVRADGAASTTGVMVHEVVAEVDAGPVVATEVVAIHANEGLASLTERMHAAEHRVLVDAVRRALAAKTA